jgi:hypothetical protein
MEVKRKGGRGIEEAGSREISRDEWLAWMDTWTLSGRIG